jgi:hypothetical protein
MADKTLHTDIERLSNTDTDGELKWCRSVDSSCPTNRNRRDALVTNPVIGYGIAKENRNLTTTYWTYVQYVLCVIHIP